MKKIIAATVMAMMLSSCATGSYVTQQYENMRKDPRYEENLKDIRKINGGDVVVEDVYGEISYTFDRGVKGQETWFRYKTAKDRLTDETTLEYIRVGSIDIDCGMEYVTFNTPEYTVMESNVVRYKANGVIGSFRAFVSGKALVGGEYIFASSTQIPFDVSNITNLSYELIAYDGTINRTVNLSGLPTFVKSLPSGKCEILKSSIKQNPKLIEFYDFKKIEGIVHKHTQIKKDHGISHVSSPVRVSMKKYY